jgi:sugar phosphate isomerase/epimerase
MDVFWIYHGGGDPVKLLNKYADRWVSLHVKDIRRAAPYGQPTGRAPDTDNVAVGSGQINWPAVIGTAGKIGVRYYFIEDETPAPLENIPASLAYLHQLKL